MSTTSAGVRPPGRLSSTEAAFAGIRVLQSRPTVLVIWAAVILVVSVLFSLAMVVVIGPQMATLQGLSGRPDPTLVGPLFARLIPFYLLMLPVLFVLYGVFYAAVNRAVLRPEASRFGYLALGADELRQAVCLLLVSLVLFGAYLVGVIGVVVLVALAALAGKIVGPLIGVVAVIGLLAFLLWIVVRLSLASPLTFATRRIRVFGSFPLTRGRFWALLGAYALSFLLVLVFYILFFVVIGAVGAVLGGGASGIAGVFRPNTSSLGDYLTPLRIVQFLLGALIAPVQTFLLLAAPASAYAQLRGSDPAEVF